METWYQPPDESSNSWVCESETSNKSGQDLRHLLYKKRHKKENENLSKDPIEDSRLQTDNYNSSHIKDYYNKDIRDRSRIESVSYWEKSLDSRSQSNFQNDSYDRGYDKRDQRNEFSERNKRFFIPEDRERAFDRNLISQNYPQRNESERDKLLYYREKDNELSKRPNFFSTATSHQEKFGATEKYTNYPLNSSNEYLQKNQTDYDAKIIDRRETNTEFLRRPGLSDQIHFSSDSANKRNENFPLQNISYDSLNMNNPYRNYPRNITESDPQFLRSSNQSSFDNNTPETFRKKASFESGQTGQRKSYNEFPSSSIEYDYSHQNEMYGCQSTYNREADTAYSKRSNSPPQRQNLYSPELPRRQSYFDVSSARSDNNFPRSSNTYDYLQRNESLRNHSRDYTDTNFERRSNSPQQALPDPREFYDRGPTSSNYDDVYKNNPYRDNANNYRKSDEEYMRKETYPKKVFDNRELEFSDDRHYSNSSRTDENNFSNNRSIDNYEQAARSADWNLQNQEDFHGSYTYEDEEYSEESIRSDYDESEELAMSGETDYEDENIKLNDEETETKINITKHDFYSNVKDAKFFEDKKDFVISKCMRRNLKSSIFKNREDRKKKYLEQRNNFMDTNFKLDTTAANFGNLNFIRCAICETGMTVGNFEKDKNFWTCNNCYKVSHLRCIQSWARSYIEGTVWKCPSCPKVRTKNNFIGYGHEISESKPNYIKTKIAKVKASQICSAECLKCAKKIPKATIKTSDKLGGFSIRVKIAKSQAYKNKGNRIYFNRFKRTLLEFKKAIREDKIEKWSEVLKNETCKTQIKIIQKNIQAWQTLVANYKKQMNRYYP